MSNRHALCMAGKSLIHEKGGQMPRARKKWGDLVQAEFMESLAYELNRMSRPMKPDLSTLERKREAESREAWGAIRDVVMRMQSQSPEPFVIPLTTWERWRRASLLKKRGVDVSPSSFPDPVKYLKATDAAIEAFNQLAEKHPVKLRLRKDGEQVIPEFAWENWHKAGLTFLWEHFFRGETWRRLKQCPVCRKWFVDKSRNRGKKRCSRQCTGRFWNRPRRRAERDRKRKEGQRTTRQPSSKPARQKRQG